MPSSDTQGHSHRQRSRASPAFLTVQDHRRCDESLPARLRPLRQPDDVVDECFSLRAALEFNRSPYGFRLAATDPHDHHEVQQPILAVVGDCRL